MLAIYILCALIPFGIVTAVIAGVKKRNVFAWFFVGLLLNVFGIVLAAKLPYQKESNNKTLD